MKFKVKLTDKNGNVVVSDTVIANNRNDALKPLIAKFHNIDTGMVGDFNMKELAKLVNLNASATKI